MTNTNRQFQAPQSLTPDELGDQLARLVWENFSDFIAIAEAEGDSALGGLELMNEEGEPDQLGVEETLIFILWAHTRGVQQAFMGRTPNETVKQVLDEMHRAVFEDMVDNGTPPSQIPFFEQRVSARYSEYHAASRKSDAALGEAVAAHLREKSAPGAELKMAVTERAVAVAAPLKDYLEDVELEE